MQTLMHMKRSLWRQLCWLVLAAGLLAVLAPTFARLMHASQTGWVEICTAQSVYKVAVQLGNASESDAGKHLQSQNHCPYCTPSAASFALPPLGTIAFIPVITPDLHVFQPQREILPVSQFLASAARPRAPPVNLA